MRRPARTGMVTLCDRDLGDFGFSVARAPNLLGNVSQSHQTSALAGLAGQLPISREAVIDATSIPIEVSYCGDTQAELVTALDTLAHWCSLGPLVLSSSYDWTKVALVSFGGLALGIPGKQFREPTLQGTLNFLRRNPYTYDRYPRRVSTNGAGAANRVELETGTAASHAIVWLEDATVATITQRDASGVIVRQSTLTTVQTAADALLIDSARSRLIAYVAGIRSEVPRDLTLGHGFLRLEPRWAHREAQRWQTLETSSGRLTIDYVRGWLR